MVPVNRSALVTLSAEMSEVIVANPDIADVHAHGLHSISVIGKRIGHTTVRAFDRSGALIREMDVSVSHDLPAIRRALKGFLPEEEIGVEMVNTNMALTGQVSSASAADKAVKIAKEFLGTGAAASGQKECEVVNLLQITGGQQVMLRVRVGEIQRSALKRLGIDPAAALNGGNFFLHGGLGTASLGRLALNNAALDTDYTIPESQFHGQAAAGWSGSNDSAFAVIKALESDGLFKLLAEPNLVAVSGEEAEFLAGGEIPIPVVQGSGSTDSVSIEYKPFGVAVKFTPYVLSDNRIRMTVMPEVSEITTTNSVTISGFSIPAISTRRARTTVELAPGESFVIAGLIQDQLNSSVDQIPGVKELPVLGALFRSTEFQRNETELVIAVTPYIVDPLKSGDVRLPTDNFMPASMMEMFFYGALGSLSGDALTVSQTPSLEGPIGFMVD